MAGRSAAVVQVFWLEAVEMGMNARWLLGQHLEIKNTKLFRLLQ